jgi:hypothetical protein
MSFWTRVVGWFGAGEEVPGTGTATGQGDREDVAENF